MMNSEISKKNRPDAEDGSDNDSPMVPKHQREKKHNTGDQLSIWEKIRLPIYREKFVHTVCICWAFIMLGWVEALFGPTFPDLRSIIHVPLNTASWLFTATSSGFLLGSVLTGALYERYNKLLLLICSILGAAGATAAIPWCERFYIMLIVKFVCGMLTASLDTGGNSEVVQTWGKHVGPYMQALHFCFALGGMIAPSMAEPFLSDQQSKPGDENNTMFGSYARNLTMFTFKPDVNKDSEVINNSQALLQPSFWSGNTHSIIDELAMGMPTENKHTPMPNDLDANGTIFINSSLPFEHDSFQTESSVHTAYLITAILTATTALPFVFMYYLKRNERQKATHTEVNNDPTNFKDIPIPLKILILLLLSSLMFVYCGTEDTFAGFLMTFCISQLKWSTSSGSLATSVHWICFGFTRLGAIYFVRFIRTSRLLLIFTILMVVSFSCLLVSSMFNIIPLIWISIGCSGFSMSVVFPAIFTWTNETILSVSGRISAMFLTSGSLGIMLLPLLFGYTMDRLSSMWFVYLLLGQSVVLVVLYTCTLMLTRSVLKPCSVDVEVCVEEEEMMPMGNFD